MQTKRAQWLHASRFYRVSNLSTARVLVVDDVDSNIFAVQAVLESLPVQVVTARSGQEALRALLLDDFALILLDAQMPVLNGLETARLLRMREHSKHVPIIFLTATNASPEFVTRGYLAGAVDYMVKPLDPIALRAKVGVFADLQVKMTCAEEEAEQLRRTSELKLQEVERESSRRYLSLLSRLSHDLRTPLNSVLGWSYVLKSSQLENTEQVHAIDTIARNARVLERLAASLLDVSGEYANKANAEDVTVDLCVLLEGVHALVVEDDPDSSELVEIVMRRFGAEVTCVATVRAALSALAARRPDVLLSDIGLPDEDGLTFIRRIRNTQGLTELPAIAITAYASQSDVRQALEAGFQAHIAKPINPSQLGNTVVKIIGSRDRARCPRPPS